MVKTLKIATLKLSNVDRYKIAQQNEYLISRFFFYITDLKFLFEVNNSLFFFFFCISAWRLVQCSDSEAKMLTVAGILKERGLW